MSTLKEKLVMIEILEMYKNMPYLWDKNHADYRNKYRRTSAKEILLEVYRKLDENANMQMFTKKILNLRTNYYKELRKVKESLANDADEGKIYEPTLWYYNAFTFLGDNSSECYQVKAKDPLKTETISPSTSDEEGSYQNSETYSSPAIKRRKFTNPIVYKNINDSLQTETAAEKPPHMENEEWEIVGKAIGLQLRDLEKKQLTIAQKIISDAIYYAKFGLLSQQTYINLGTPPL